MGRSGGGRSGGASRSGGSRSGGSRGGGFTRSGGFGGSRGSGMHSSRGGGSGNGSFFGRSSSKSFSRNRPKTDIFGDYSSSPFSRGGTPNPVRRRPLIFSDTGGFGPNHGNFSGPGGGGEFQPPLRRRSPHISIGCFRAFLLIVLILVVAAVVFGGLWSAFYGDHREANRPAVSYSSKNRDPLPKGSVRVDAGYYTDELGWISNRRQLERGMESFYEKTGVMPYLYIIDSIDGETNPPLNAFTNFANDAYDALFEDRNGEIDEAHVLVIFQKHYDGEYRTYYLSGIQAKAVIDDEAGDILLDYIDLYYHDRSLDNTEFLAKAFEDAGIAIMKVTRPNWYYPTITIGTFLIVVSIVGLIAFVAKKRREKAELNKEILSTPLEKFGDIGTDDAAEKLAQKYLNLEDNDKEDY